jgi:hypothetical protein
MRILNETEKDLCLRILKGDGNNNYLGNIIDHKLEGVRISLNRKQPNVELLFTIQGQYPTPEETEMVIYRISEISIEILTAVNLINLLEKDGYIMLMQMGNQIPNESEFGRGIGNMPSIGHHFSDRKISELLIEYTAKEIIVTEEFRQFCKHKFIARDEQRFRRQIGITTSALAVAIFALIFNTIFNLMPKSNYEGKIRSEQIDSINSTLVLINKSLDSLNRQTKQMSGSILNELKQIKNAKNTVKKKKNPML